MTATEPAPAPTVIGALNQVMEQVRAVGKDSKNTTPGQGGYSFRGIDAVVNAVGPALRAHKVVVMPTVLDRVYGTVVVGRNRSEMSHCRLTVQYRFFGPGGDYVDAVVDAEAMDSGDKATAKAHSVAYRTALIQALCLPTDEPDPDETSYQRSDREDPDTARRRANAEAIAAQWSEQVYAFINDPSGTLDAGRRLWTDAVRNGRLDPDGRIMSHLREHLTKLRDTAPAAAPTAAVEQPAERDLTRAEKKQMHDQHHDAILDAFGKWFRGRFDGPLPTDPAKLNSEKAAAWRERFTAASTQEHFESLIVVAEANGWDDAVAEASEAVRQMMAADNKLG